jgi:hypothetical protein
MQQSLNLPNPGHRLWVFLKLALSSSEADLIAFMAGMPVKSSYFL